MEHKKISGSRMVFTSQARKKLTGWFGRQDRQTQTDILRDYALRMRAAADKKRSRHAGRLNDADRMEEFLMSCAAAERIEHKSVPTGDEMGQVENEKKAREERRKKERPWASAERRFLEKRGEIVVHLHDDDGYSFRLIREAMMQQYRRKFSLGLLYQVYREAKAIAEKAPGDVEKLSSKATGETVAGSL